MGRSLPEGPGGLRSSKLSKVAPQFSVEPRAWQIGGSIPLHGSRTAGCVSPGKISGRCDARKRRIRTPSAQGGLTPCHRTGRRRARGSGPGGRRRAAAGPIR
ncbi:conserved hypothetical protein [Streptomyces pristinaespiralis ATCC 25486]|uniref:Uncharacterized protein n=1 Tax=Streptomyces pristinaespiralis (strain ATCC 25486 / DSM 40338 / CBS 914.69 / JCM 4507 / KCC S-0507 / NBRC 13074 / NRRL 2958 / 5647) TaxID=457429 RepID=B5H8Z0_STRE2|nr:conserved hypothetical protein [Streptomyces pristinaespiralis ATCC 25486]